ncbi:hypothetical protein UT300005_09080 [Clostridium sp. CTA-5]
MDNYNVLCTDNYDSLYNVNKILVKPGLECLYKKFSKKLNKYLLKKYPEYYAGLQLYESNKYCNEFYVIARYNDVCGIYQAITKIRNDIERIYNNVWDSSVKRTSIFAFSNYKRVIPPED